MLPGDIVLDHYEVIEPLPSGAQADVSLATDQASGNTVVIKQLARTPGSTNYNQELARFQRAAHLHIPHPAIVNPLAYKQQGDEHYMILPYEEGRDLGSSIQANGGRLPHAEALRLVGLLLDALAALHAHGVIHRDIKPANIIVRPDGQIRLIDLGICRISHETTITDGCGLLGSPQYMAPEQFDNPTGVDQRADLYAAGAVLFFMLTGGPPFQESDIHTLRQRVLQSTAPSLRSVDPSIPAHLDTSCHRLLARNPADRPATAQEAKQLFSGGASSEVCNSCQATVDPNAKFCQACGCLLGSPSAQVFCFACGAEIGQANRCPGCSRHFSQTDHRLVFNTGAMAGCTYRIPEGIYEFGRASLCPRDMQISRMHGKVACVNGEVFLQAANSKNRMHVEGQHALNPLLLQSGQRVQVAGNVGEYLSLKGG